MESSHSSSPYDGMQQGVKVLHPGSDEAIQKTKIDIVLVPGLGANPQTSWESPKTKFSWPTDANGLISDFPAARILLHMYESAWIGHRKVNQSIINAAGSLLQGLDSHSPKNTPRRPIVFIGHSMGGLVIAKAVTLMETQREQYPNMLEAVAGAAFFGAPFRGANAALWAGVYCKLGNSMGKDYKPQLLSLMDPQSGELNELRNDFKRLAARLQPPISLCCFWEQHPTDYAQFVGLADPFGLVKSLMPQTVNVEVVTQHSATLDGAHWEIGLACDHRGLVKFDGPKDMNWNQRVRDPLRKMINAAPLAVRNRLNAIRDVDHQLIGDVTSALETAPVSKKLDALSKTLKPSSWIPKQQEFIEWLDPAWARQPSHKDTGEDHVDSCPAGGYIWIRGPQGRGKTSATLAAIAEVEKLQRRLEGPDDQVLRAYFFCNEKDEYSTAEDVLKSIITQLIRQQRALAVYAKQFTKNKDRSKARAQATVENLWRALDDMLWDELVGTRTRVYFVLNNLHALPRPSDSTDKLLAYINTALNDNLKEDDKKQLSTRWFITSREDVDSVEAALDVEGKRLINLMDPKYEDQVQRELRMYAKTGLESLASKKNYSRALRYLAGGLIGGRASSTQWIDVMYMLLQELPQGEEYVNVRSELEAMPHELQSLLSHSWQGFFRSNEGDVHKMKEMLRTLVLTYHDPTEAELGVLAGFSSSRAQKTELRALVDKCRPLLRTRLVRIRKSGEVHTVVAFASAVVKEHLLENSKELLGLDNEERKWQHGIITHRCFAYLYERFDVDPETAGRDDESADSHAPDADTAMESEEGDQEADEADEATMEDAKTSYPVKCWLKHASEATLEVAQELSQENDFWQHDSRIRRRWLDEYAKTEITFSHLDHKTMTSLHIACSIGFRELVEALIQEGHQDQINVHDSLENTPLHLAAYFDQVRIIDALLRSGAKIDDQGSGGNEETPLHMAAHQGRIDVIKKLIREKADPNAIAADTGPVINAAICSGVGEAVDLLIACGASLNVTPNDKDMWYTPVELAALHWNLPMFESLIQKSSDKIPPAQYSQALVLAAYAGRNDVFEKLLGFQHDQKDYQEALEAAAEEENWEISKMILNKCLGLDCDELFYQAAKGAEPQVSVLETAWKYADCAISPETLARSLYDATDMEKESTVRFLLDTCRADPNATGEEFGNALTAAAFDGTINLVQMLVEAGADVNSPDGWALQVAAAKGHYDVVEMLLEQGAEVNACTDNPAFLAGTALQGACEAAELEIVGVLLDRKADPNLGRGPESPPAVAAALRGAEDILKKLVDAKAKVNVFDGDDETTLLIKATAYLQVESLRLLLDAGASVNLADKYGNTPLITAAEIDDEEAVELFLDYGADILHVNDDGKNAMQIALEENSEDSLEILVDRVSNVLASLRTRRDAGNTEIAQLIREAIGSSEDQGTEVDVEEQRPTEPQQEHTSVSGTVRVATPPPKHECWSGDGQYRCTDGSTRERELEGRSPTLTANFYEAWRDQPPSPTADAYRTWNQQEQQKRSPTTQFDASQQGKQADYKHEDPGQLQDPGLSQSMPKPPDEGSTPPRLPPRPLPDRGPHTSGMRPVMGFRAQRNGRVKDGTDTRRQHHMTEVLAPGVRGTTKSRTLNRNGRPYSVSTVRR
ncbi:ankyrin repeats (3 copies) domain-containing protein [Hirsutella rhossiliensis]|uniref:Ankyrin repeats (3 copies) domain-containing protein n=1 Tax=Hirsutella rhossiliensis TaxID=111463 RepID=A0A9P8N453_9HYPO|nr:ankyrin repeats (3 copies) domain-containing protein [Hirsutella rhossiliensis]KAH0966570.1 ankyrin repeats (3 copies) domain-containing protein [Hirsutella rhossiliensis]